MNAGADPGEDGWTDREDQYARVRTKYGDDFQLLPRMLGHLVLDLESGREGRGFDDVLGNTFEALELQNKDAGQFFTPMAVCDLMAEISAHDLSERLQQDLLVDVLEPACGCGRAVLALTNVLWRQGYPPTRLRVCAFDIDPLCVAMAHITLSLVLGLRVYADVASACQNPHARTAARLQPKGDAVRGANGGKAARVTHGLAWENGVGVCRWTCYNRRTGRAKELTHDVPPRRPASQDHVRY
jgi:hypothetical protein